MRLNPDGTNDNTFRNGITTVSFNSAIYDLVIQPDDKIVFGGSVSSSTVNINRIGRLNSDGSLDASFQPGTGPNNDIYTMALQSDGKIVVGGRFTTFNSVQRSKLARLNADGSLDQNFFVSTLSAFDITRVVVQSDGKFLVSQYSNGETYLSRLLSDGRPDTEFDNSSERFRSSFNLSSINILPDNKILVTGVFSASTRSLRRNIARLNSNGSLDASFNPSRFHDGNGRVGQALSIKRQTDGKLIIGGNFTSYNGLGGNDLIRLNTDGSPDNTFNVGVGFGSNQEVYAVTLQTDGKVLVGGLISQYQGAAAPRLIRLNANGSRDNSFATPTIVGNSCRVNAVAVQPDGKILVGFSYDPFGAPGRQRILRLNADGSIDNTFNAGNFGSQIINACWGMQVITLQPDGKILIGGGALDSYNGVTMNAIARLNPDGSRDASFNTGTGFSRNGGLSIRAITLQPDGKVIVGGSFSLFNGTSRNCLVRLNADGSLDNTFITGTGPNWNVNTVAVQTDGKILIGGEFTAYNNITANYLARLNSDGTLENPSSFTTGTGFNTWVQAVVPEPNNRIVVGGWFSTYNGNRVDGITRIIGACTPPPKPTITLNNDAVTGVILLSSSSAQNNQWLRDNQPIAGATGQTLRITASGSYAVRVMVDGCSNTSDALVVTAAETSANINQSLVIFPNPAIDQMTIRYSAPRKASVVRTQVFNLMGVKISELSLQPNSDGNWEGAVKTSTLPAGSYVIRIEDSKQTLIRTFVKQ